MSAIRVRLKDDKVLEIEANLIVGLMQMSSSSCLATLEGGEKVLFCEPFITVMEKIGAACDG